MRTWNEYTGQEVTLYAMGITYKGRIIEMTEGSVLLRSDLGHREIPMGAVVKIEPINIKVHTLANPSPLVRYSR